MAEEVLVTMFIMTAMLPKRVKSLLGARSNMVDLNMAGI